MKKPNPIKKLSSIIFLGLALFASLASAGNVEGEFRALYGDWKKISLKELKKVPLKDNFSLEHRQQLLARYQGRRIALLVSLKRSRHCEYNAEVDPTSPQIVVGILEDILVSHSLTGRAKIKLLVKVPKEDSGNQEESNQFEIIPIPLSRIMKFRVERPSLNNLPYKCLKKSEFLDYSANFKRAMTQSSAKIPAAAYPYESQYEIQFHSLDDRSEDDLKYPHLKFRFK